jgi:hypothetical protein
MRIGRSHTHFHSCLETEGITVQRANPEVIQELEGRNPGWLELQPQGFLVKNSLDPNPDS